MNTKIKPWLTGVIFAACLAAAPAFAQAVDQAEEIKALVVKHDLNGNGKIDASEHKEFARERARLLRAKAIEEARKRPPGQPGERLVIPPARWTRELFQQYDANQNGRLDPEERAQEREDRVKAATEAAPAKAR